MLKSTVLNMLHVNKASSPGSTEAFLGTVIEGGGSEIQVLIDWSSRSLSAVYKSSQFTVCVCKRTCQIRQRIYTEDRKHA